MHVVKVHIKYIICYLSWKPLLLSCSNYNNLIMYDILKNVFQYPESKDQTWENILWWYVKRESRSILKFSHGAKDGSVWKKNAQRLEASKSYYNFDKYPI